jgi:hypothetical protein
MVTFEACALSMSFMAWLMVWQAPLPPKPQQPVESSPLAPSTAMLPLLARPVTPPAQHDESAVSQKAPATQLLESVQVVRQAFMPQMKGVHWVTPGAGQLPIPSQTLGFCWVSEAQLSRVVPQATEASG